VTAVHGGVTPFTQSGTGASATYAGSGGASYGTRDAGSPGSCSVSVAGTLTAHFQWNNGGDATATPGGAIVTETSTVSWSGTAGGNATSSGSLASGMNGTPPANATSFTDSRQSVHAGASFDVTCSPSAGFSGTTVNQSDSYVYGNAAVTYSAVASRITLLSPDPLGHPEQGDHTNQFVYDGATPDGNLIIPGIISASGASLDSMQFLLTGDTAHYNGGSAADIKMDAPLQATLYGGIQEASAGRITYVHGLSSPYTDGMWFLGLPSANSGFGNHLATLKVEGQDTQQAHLRTFFSRGASNWPTSTGAIPNWFHYWSMTSASFGSPVYVSGTRSETVYDPTTHQWVAHIEDDIVAGSFSSYENAEGIDAFAWTCRHEAQHVANATTWWGTTVVTGTNPATAYDVSRDSDHDNIPDTLEASLGQQFHPELPDGYSSTQSWTPMLDDEFRYGNGFNDNEDYTERMQRANHPWTNGKTRRVIK